MLKCAPQLRPLQIASSNANKSRRCSNTTNPEPAAETKTESATHAALDIKTMLNGSDSTPTPPSTNGHAQPVENSAPVAAPQQPAALAKPAEAPSQTSASLAERPVPEASAVAPGSEPAAAGAGASLPAPVPVEAPVATPKIEDAPMKDAAPSPPAAAPAQQPVEKPEAAVDAKMEDVADTKPAVETPANTQPSQTSATTQSASEIDLQQASVSQLNLDTQPEESIMPSVEVAMTDAPAPTKVAREREEDVVDEPAAKRARTEPEEDKPIPSTETVAKPGPAAEASAPTTTATATATTTEAPVATATATPASAAADPSVPGTPAEVLSVDSLHKWNDPEAMSRELTAFRRREIRKIIGRVKKTKSGANFKDSVPKLWPQLADAYLAKIDHPVDLSEIERKTRDETGYKTLGQFKDDLGLIHKNALTFNGPTHDVTAGAFNVVKMVWEDALPLPAEEPARPKPIPKAKPVREARTPTSTTPQRTLAEGSSKLDASLEADRPKRNIRAPKPKDIDYTTKPSRKKLKPELQFCFEVMDEIMHPKNDTLIEWFKVPVDAEGLNIPHYYSIIKKPMDLGKVNTMLQAGEFTSLKEFDKTVRLIFDNCYQFNGPVDQGNVVSLRAKDLENFYNNLMKDKDNWLARFAKANAPVAASNDSEDDEDDEDDDMDDAPAVDNSKEIQELTAKLGEETSKLHAMFVPGANQSLIDIQKGIVDMVQAALMKAVASGGEAQARAPKKPGRGGRPKGSGSRKSLSGQPKKTPGPKKGAAKRTLSASDKDAIANAINDLEYPHLDRAIDIIKKDTGQNENNDGELELDIDQLSNDALLKLWELCKKALPGFGKGSAFEAAEKAAKAPKAAPSSSSLGKPKKNKPMSAQEQEARIAQLTALRQMYKDGQETSDITGGAGDMMISPPAGADSSDDSDSEEE